MNSAMKRGNGNIRASLFFVGFVVAWLFILSEYAMADFWIDVPVLTEADCECENGGFDCE